MVFCRRVYTFILGLIIQARKVVDLQDYSYLTLLSFSRIFLFVYYYEIFKLYNSSLWS